MTRIGKGDYSYEGCIYQCLGECSIKTNKDWIAGVIYMNKGKFYVRPAADFDSKFKLIPLVPFKRNTSDSKSLSHSNKALRRTSVT